MGILPQLIFEPREKVIFYKSTNKSYLEIKYYSTLHGNIFSSGFKLLMLLKSHSLKV